MTKRTALYALHLEQSAKMFDFADWMVPLHYGSQLDEHRIVRSACGMFDISHLGILEVEGNDAKMFLRRCLANDVGKSAQGCALYSCLLREDGKILDDLLVYQLTEKRYYLVVNAATTQKDLAWLQEHTGAMQVTIRIREDLGMLAVQGPQAPEMIIRCSRIAREFNTLKPFQFLEFKDTLLARTGCTGEDGFEWIIPVTKIAEYWCKLLALGVKPVGFGARDTLRLEAGFNLYGQDMDEKVTPLDVHLAKTVAFEPRDRIFIGREALEKQKKSGNFSHLLGVLLLETGMLRPGMELIGEDGSLGYITSGNFSPTLKQSIGLARFSHWDHQRYSVLVRDQFHAVEVVEQPFVRYGKACFKKVAPTCRK